MNSIQSEHWRQQVAELDAQGRTEDALNLLKRVAFERPDDASLGFMVGERLKKGGHLSDAALVFALVSNLNDEHLRFRALLERAECLRLTGDYSGAITVIARAMMIDPGSHWPVVAMAEVYASAGRDSERLEFLERHYEALRPDGKAELARYASGMQAYWQFEATRAKPGWGPMAPERIPALEKAGIILLVKDEADIIGQNLMHHYTLGFRSFCVINNMSTDRTKEKIEDFREQHLDAFVLLVDDPVAGHYQAKKMTIYADVFVKHAALADYVIAWLFFIDADEFIAAENTFSMGAATENFERYLNNKSNKIIVFHWVHCASFLPKDVFDAQSNPFKTFNKYTSRLLPVVPKISYRSDSNFEIMEGNHFVKSINCPLNAVITAALGGWYIWHFSLRSKDHVRKKIINGGRAFEGTIGLESHGGHWRERYSLYQKYGEPIVSQVLQNHIDSILELDNVSNADSSTEAVSDINNITVGGNHLLSLGEQDRHLLNIRDNSNDWEVQLADVRRHAEQFKNNVELFRRLAWLQAVSGLLDEAEATLLASAEMPGDRGNAFYSIAALRLAQGDVIGMSMFFDRALSISDVSQKKLAEIEDLKKSFVGDRFFMPFVLDSVGVEPFAHDFLCFVGPQKISAAEGLTYARFMEHALPKIGLISDVAVNILEHDHELNGPSYWYHLHLGHHFWLNGNRAKTDFHYGQARSESLSKKIMPTHFNAGVLTWLDSSTVDRLAVEQAADFAGVSGWHWCTPSDELVAPQLTIIVGCDSRYFVYFPKLLLSLTESLMSAAPENITLLHVHIAEPDRPQLEFLEKWSKYFNHAGSKLYLSYAFGSLKYADAGIFTCLRFLALPEILARYNANTVIIDIDNIISADFFKQIRGLKAADLALRMHNFDDSQRQIAGEPWSINASQMYVAANEIGKLYGKILKNFISVAYDPSLPTNWTIDQNAVGQGFDYCRKKYPELNIIDLAKYESITVMPHNVGGKEALYNLGGAITISNFEEFLRKIL
ncbi:glycosyltransferase family 2 protein [Acidiphilium sp. PA]|uniref:glycosyltransferase family 2 protein n=1 Tax=Acidiphilium sp. PA TaxID=2871705 RepID=UPI002243A0DC|nr:glycosyltransferase family 2 protein [Acidiphilium sp. PA]MCW8306981.1 glycosyltransferase family 2 protein [Acidiphilium sp. PA]